MSHDNTTDLFSVLVLLPLQGTVLFRFRNNYKTIKRFFLALFLKVLEGLVAYVLLPY